MMHRGILFGLATLAVCLSLTTNVQAAGPIATQAMTDLGTTTAGGTASGDINTATSFGLGDLVSNTNNTGNLAGMGVQNFGAVAFNTATATSFNFGNATFGTFASTSITEATNVSGTVAFYILGNYTIAAGSFAVGTGATAGTYPASITISLTQTPATNGTISASATFSVPPAAQPGVPEPAGIVMGLTSLVICGAAYRFRRRRPSGNAAA